MAVRVGDKEKCVELDLGDKHDSLLLIVFRVTGVTGDIIGVGLFRDITALDVTILNKLEYFMVDKKEFKKRKDIRFNVRLLITSIRSLQHPLGFILLGSSSL